MTIKILITVGASATSGTRVASAVTASWSGDGVLQDVAKASVQVP